MKLQEMPGEYHFAINLTKEAGLLVKSMQKSSTTSYKSKREIVTTADLAADRLIRDKIQTEYPNDSILSEEQDSHSYEQSGRIWIIDPIDGTANFAYGHPYYAVSIALFEKGLSKVGAVYNPFLDEMYSAAKNMGAFLNGVKMTTPPAKSIHHAIFGTGIPYSQHLRAKACKWITEILSHISDIRRNGSAALDICHVASGRLDGYFETVSIWDCAAAILIAQEAKCKCGHIYPLPDHLNPIWESENLLVCSTDLYPVAQKILSQVPVSLGHNKPKFAKDTI